MADSAPEDLKFTPLNAWHIAKGARMVPFAGYNMPVQYPTGILTEHLFTRESAGLFDVSHMGQCFIESGSWEMTARAIEALVPADVLNLKPGQIRYSQLTAEDGGTLDDLMITRTTTEGVAYLVVNAGCKDADYAHIAAHLPAGVTLNIDTEMALVALQGPKAVDVLAALIPEVRDMPFMTCLSATHAGQALHISRSGYTGEDGYEIAVPASGVVAFCDTLLSDDRVKPIGLGARDSLRLEAGLSLYGHELDPTISPVEAGLKWSIQKRRREEGGFPGAACIQRELKDGPRRLICGIQGEGRQPAREGTEVFAQGRKIGQLTSGGFGPSVGGPVALGLIETEFTRPGTALTLVVRGKELPAKVVSLPFVPHRYIR